MTASFSFGLLLAPTLRSRAYLQVLCAAGLVPSPCILLPGNEPEWSGPQVAVADLYGTGAAATYRPGDPLRKTAAAHMCEVVEAPCPDVNEAAFIDWFSNLAVRDVVYSGIGGCMLRPPLLRCGKRFLHAHGGVAPRYSGSTAFYFSVLEGNALGATVFWMDTGIDTGPVILRTQCQRPMGVDLDNVFDPLMRADALVQAIRLLATDPDTRADPVDDLRTTYHVIHPVLRHLVGARCGTINPMDAGGSAAPPAAPWVSGQPR